MGSTMKTIRIIALAALAALTAPTVGHAAAVLVSPPLPANLPSVQTLYCDIVNRDKVARNVTIEIMDGTGTPINTYNTALLPNQGDALGDGSGSGQYCRFTVDGSAKKFRAMAIYDNAAAYTVSVPAY
jgi:hypothetical protein